MCACSDLNEQNSIAIPHAPFIMHIIDVGQGDSILLQCDDHFMLIDSGESTAENSVKNHLKSAGVQKLDYTVITHPHSDHCGAMKSILTEYSTDCIIMPNISNNTPTWESLVDYIDNKNIPVKKATAGDTYNLGSCKITVLAPNSEDYDNLNNYSVVIKAVYKNTSFMLTGDAEILSEKEMMKNGFDLSADVLKLGHHGSRTSSSKKFLQAVNPKYAVISDGKDNDYEHPHKEILERLEQLEIPVYRTDLLGSIMFASDGKNVKPYNSYEELLDTVTQNTDTASSVNGTNSLQASSDTSDSGNSENSKNNESNTAFVGNKNSHVVHKANCKSVKNMKDKNKIYFSSYEEAVNNNYTPCENCKPSD